MAAICKGKIRWIPIITYDRCHDFIGDKRPVVFAVVVQAIVMGDLRIS